MNKKENQRIRLTKTLLKNSLIDLMRTSPINKITIREICGQAGINRSTFYLYYTDSYALLEEIEGELLAHARERLERLDSNMDNRHDLQELLSYIKEHADIFKTLLCRQDNLSFQLKFIDSSIKNLRLNVALECSEHISDYVYGFLTAGCLSIITKWISADFDMDSKALSEIIIRLSAGAASSYSS
ncbi:hypothetical protein D3C75_528070 [compost metagenome]